jgi:hypothetical protein
MNMSEIDNGPSAARRSFSYVVVSLQLAGAGLILLSAFIPWVRSHALFLTIPVNGVATDYGRLFPGVALAVFVLLAYQWSFGRRRLAHGLILLLGVVALTVAVLYAVQVTQRVNRIAKSAQEQLGSSLTLSGDSPFRLEFDIGYYLTLLGACGLVAGSVMGFRGHRHPVSSDMRD